MHIVYKATTNAQAADKGHLLHSSIHKKKSLYVNIFMYLGLGVALGS